MPKQIGSNIFLEKKHLSAWNNVTRATYKKNLSHSYDLSSLMFMSDFILLTLCWFFAGSQVFKLSVWDASKVHRRNTQEDQNGNSYVSNVSFNIEINNWLYRSLYKYLSHDWEHESRNEFVSGSSFAGENTQKRSPTKKVQLEHDDLSEAEREISNSGILLESARPGEVSLCLATRAS